MGVPVGVGAARVRGLPCPTVAPEPQGFRAFIYRFTELRQVPAKEVRPSVRRRVQRAWAWPLGVRRERKPLLRGPSPRAVGISVLAPRIPGVEASGLGAGPCLFLECDLE